MKLHNIAVFRSFRAKVTLALILSMLLAATLSNLLIYRFALNNQFNDLRTKLMVIAQTAALAIDSDMLLRVPLNKEEGLNSPEYKVIAEKLKQIRECNPPVKYIYTMKKTEKEGIWQFIVDPTPLERGLTAYPGNYYDASRFPEMFKAFQGPSADTKLEIDEWGITLSGYAPVYDKNGKAVAMLGVDVMADAVITLQKQIHRIAILVFTAGTIFSLILGIFISRQITNRIKIIVEGTHHIANGELNYIVQVDGHDEVSELAQAFNTMAKSLFKSERKTQHYFYRAMQALIRILEAKDPYTRGHSDRVAEYAEKIGRKMDLPRERIELLKRAAELHDIGKLGIQKTILNKNGTLTEEEWKIIKEHPIVGEHILKPVAFNKELLSIVRSHHERYDGQGYPDKICGKGMNICAQIVAVADAYDAMTSPRAYRPALENSEAIKRIKENKEVQFNPQVVDAFLEVFF